ncbi:hypothetical protein SUNI508_13898 [Seiridium unicorne]|uniref:Uncharacterized protein n=1 Tax=Seiridium unicorne TaxID=138068 RepID=A0ABR2VAM6_9PEZI
METDNSCLPDGHIFPFLELPYHIRHDIYLLTVDYPDLSPVFAYVESQQAEIERQHYASKLPLSVLPKPQVPARFMTTPGLLLANRQIAWEAQEAMCFKTFKLRQPPPRTDTLARSMDITDFISEGTLQTIRRVELVMDLTSQGDWSKTVELLLDVWAVRNHLRSIDVTLKQPASTQEGEFWHGGSSRRVVRMLSMLQSFATEAGTQLTGSPLPAPNVMRDPVD